MIDDGFRHRILVVDDDAATREALAGVLGSEGYDVSLAESAEEALDLLRRDSFHLALIDHQLPGRSGTELTAAIAEACPMTAVIFVSGNGTVSTAVKAMKLGALDYVAKPVDASKLRILVATVLARRPRWVPNKLLEADGAPVLFDGMAARSHAMREVFEKIRLAAETDTTVLVTGESGTGKELVARSIHNRSRRAPGPFLAVNTGAIPAELVASELFGHEKGAFTGAIAPKEGKFDLAAKGTIFLDEIDTMDDRTQVGLLRVLETLRVTRVGARKDHAVDVRVVAATNAKLAERVAQGKFREDLYYRLAIFPIEVPPLRARREDIALLATIFLETFTRRYGRDLPVLSRDAIALLERHPWPGNVRELRNAIEQAGILCQGKVLEVEHLPAPLRGRTADGNGIWIAVNTPLEDVEREVVLHTLAANAGNKNRTARILGISRRSLYDRLARWGSLTGQYGPVTSAE